MKENYLEFIFDGFDDELSNAFCGASHIRLISPFIRFKAIKRLMKHNKYNRLEIITRFNEGDIISGVCELQALEYLYNASKVEVRGIANLHSKVYIFDKEKLIVSSANLTNSGLSLNHEAGIATNDRDTINSSLCYFDNLWNDGKVLDEILLNKIKKKVQAGSNINSNKGIQKKRNKDWGGRSSRNAIRRKLTIPKQTLFELLDNAKKIWLKPNGTNDNRVNEKESFGGNDNPKVLAFAKKPSGIQNGDIIIAYAVGSTYILGIFEANKNSLDNFKIDDDSDWRSRWSWYLEGKSLTPKFGNTWIKHKVSLTDLKNSFSKTNPNESLTPTSKSLGGLNYGQDKLRLSKSFAHYICKRIMAYED